MRFNQPFTKQSVKRLSAFNIAAMACMATVFAISSGTSLADPPPQAKGNPPAQAGPPPDKRKPPLVLETAGAMFVGGETIHADRPCIVAICDPSDGTIRVQHVPAFFMIPATQKHKLPVVMVPGLGLREALYMTTTDGREGWAQFFVRRGFAVYTTSQSNVTAAGFNVNPFNRAKAGDTTAAEQPELFHWTPEIFWDSFGYGPAFPEVFTGVRFDMDTDFVPLISGVTPADFSITDEQRAAGITAVLEKTGPAILITHSQSGPTGFDVARARPDLVKAYITIEPIGCPTDEADVAANFADLPVLSVFGDHIPVRPGWPERAAQCATTAAIIEVNGGVADRIILPDDLGIFGNTHMMMGEDNSDELADFLVDWIKDNVH